MELTKEEKEDLKSSDSSLAVGEPPAVQEHEAKEVKCPNEDEELDINSEKFNPLKALYAPEYRVTKNQPRIIYQNMAAFETALKKVGILGLNSAPENTQASGSKAAKNKDPLLVSEEPTQRRFQDHQMAIRTQAKVKSKHQRNLMMKMAQAEGPLKQLKQFVEQGTIIRVLIRRQNGVKGCVEGMLKMFDRHWNLLMVDVLECLEMRKYKYAEDKLCIHQEPQDCSYLLKKLGISLPQQSVKSLDRKRVEIKRHLPQLLLRGEQVVLVSAKVSVL